MAAVAADLDDGETVRRLVAESLGGPAPASRAGGAMARTSAPMDADLRLLLERMWKVIPDQQGGGFAGGWVNRCKAAPRAMRYAVDKFLENPPKVRTKNWQWLRAEYIAAARRMGLAHLLSPEDQERRGWWSAVASTMRGLLMGGTFS